MLAFCVIVCDWAIVATTTTVSDKDGQTKLLLNTVEKHKEFASQNRVQNAVPIIGK